jgi:hypothetical protein
MSEFQEIDPRGSGLDTDSNFRVMDPNDSDHRLNCIYDTPLDENDLGDVQNDWGMILQGYTQPAGVNEVIGSLKDLENNAIIYWVWNSQQRYQIRRWFASTGITQLIMESVFFNFQRNSKINHANIIGDELTWTDGYQGSSQMIYNSPRNISISKAIGYTLGQPWPQGYTVVNLQTIEAIKYPPLHPPTQALVTVPNFQSLFIGQYLQGFYRWTYFNGSKPVYSPIAPLIISQNEDADGNFTYSVDNAIDITVQTGAETVTKIEICFKINNAYYTVDVLDKYDSTGTVIIPSNSTHTYRYFGDRIINTLSELEVLKTHDTLPQVAGCQEMVDANTLVYADITEGYSTPDTDLTATVKMKKATPVAPPFNLVDYGESIKYRQISFKMRGIYRIAVNYKDAQGRPCPASSPNTAQVQIPWWQDPNTYAEYYDPSDEWIKSLNQKPYIEWSITSTPPIQAVSYEILCTKDLRDLELTYYFPQWGSALGDEDGIYQNEKTTLVIPSTVGYSYTKGDRLRLVGEYNLVTTLGLSSNLVAPPGFGAGFYPQTVVDTYTGSLVYDFEIEKFDIATGRVSFAGQVKNLEPTSTYIWEIYNPTRKTTASSDGGENGELFYSVGQSYDVLNPGQTNRSHSVGTGTIEGVDVFHRWKKIVWKPQRVKFRVDQIAVPYTPPVSPINTSVILNVGNLVTSTIFKASVSTTGSPVEANLQDAQTSITVSEWKDEKFGTTFNGTWNSFNMFYEPASPIPGIIVPGANISIVDSTIINILSGNIVSQNIASILLSLLSAANTIPLAGSVSLAQLAGIKNIILNGSDTIIEFNTRNNPNLIDKQDDFNIYMLCESHSLSDFYESDIDSTGKAFVENPLETRKRYETNLRHGGLLQEDNQINNLFSFNADDFNNRLLNTYNEITKIRYVGYTLNIRQRNKNNSMYIRRQEIQDTAGNLDLIETPEVFGTINPSMQNWGSSSPSADISSGDNMYFFNIQDGKVIRDSVNGMVPISCNKESGNDPYKMDNFFRALAKKVRDNPGKFEVLGVWDDFIKCYVLTVRDLRQGGNDSVTIIFHEPTNRWKSKMSYVPEWYENIGDTTVSFKDGNLWKHYADPENRINYYGVKYPQEWAVICNLGYSTRKVFNNIKIDSNIPWDCDITIPPTATYPSGMKSQLLKEQFENLEGGGFFSSFMKDMNTPGYTNPTLALVNGRELRGEVMRVLLTNNEKNVASLRSVTIWLEPSEQTN